MSESEPRGWVRFAREASGGRSRAPRTGQTAAADSLSCSPIFRKRLEGSYNRDGLLDHRTHNLRELAAPLLRDWRAKNRDAAASLAADDPRRGLESAEAADEAVELDLGRGGNALSCLEKLIVISLPPGPINFEPWPWKLTVCFSRFPAAQRCDQHPGSRE